MYPYHQRHSPTSSLISRDFSSSVTIFLLKWIGINIKRPPFKVHRLSDLPSPSRYHVISFFFLFALKYHVKIVVVHTFINFSPPILLPYACFQSSFRAYQLAKKIFLSRCFVNFKFQFLGGILLDLPGILEKVSHIFLLDMSCLLFDLSFRMPPLLVFFYSGQSFFLEYSVPWWFNLFTWNFNKTYIRMVWNIYISNTDLTALFWYLKLHIKRWTWNIQLCPTVATLWTL